MKNNLQIFYVLMTMAIASGAAFSSSAAEVRVGLSARETYVGLPITLRIQVANATKAELPTVPSVDGLDVKSLGTPAHSTQITTINGHTTTSTTQTFAYELTPQRAGKFQIPPITVNADGATQQTRAIEFVASKSETGDLMFVEIAGKEKQIYVGQALDLTLKVWVRPYSDRRLKITLSEGDMWRLISERTEWGQFAVRLQQLAQNDQRPVGKETLRKDGDGVEHSYYLYRVDATIYPKRPGTIDADNVKVVMNYPTALGRSRGLFANFFDDMPGGPSGPFGDEDGGSPFGSQLTIQTVRPLVGHAVVEPINVLPIPTAGRPANYRGAVGQYQIGIDATPTHVKSGDPINLLIGISGTGPMELVQAPPLSEIPELAADFKVPNEPLAGFVKGDQKMFQASIRPRKQGITRIPSIPFSYFDPAAQKFVTVWSAPVSIQVNPADMLALDAVVGSGKTTNADPNAKQPAATAAAPTSLANFTSDDVLTNETPWALNLRQLLVLLALPPFVVLGVVVVRTRASFSHLSGRFGSADGRLQRTVAHAKGSAEVAGAIKTFIARQCKLKGDTLDTERVIGAIRASGCRNLAIRCERLLNMCANEGLALPFSGEDTLDGLKLEASQWLHDWQSESRRQRVKPIAGSFKQSKSARKPTSLHSSTSTIVAAIIMVGSSLVAGQRVVAQSVELNGVQQQTLLVEANKCYSTALEKVKSDLAEAKQGFADAADKYQLLVGAGVVNSCLYFNLGNAYLESGQTEKAIANYLRCLRIDSTMQQAQMNLAYAKKLVHSPADTAAVKAQDRSADAYVTMANGWFNSHISPRAVFAITAIAWIAIWMILGLRIIGLRFPWKSATGVVVLLFILTAASSMLSSQTSGRHLAVIVHSQIAAPTNADVAAAKVREGQVVEIIQQRGDSIRIRTESGEAVWVPRESVEII